MKFFITGEHLEEDRGLVRLAIGISLVFLVFWWFSNIFLFVNKMGFSYSSVAEYYLGQEETFKSPVTYSGLLEVTHAHLFAYAFMLMLLNHLVIFAAISAFARYVLIATTSLGGVLDIFSGWLIVYLHEGFAWVKIVSFVVFEISVAIALIVIALSFLSKRNPPLKSPHSVLP